MIIHNFEQGTETWKACRTGKLTASRFSDVMASGKGGSPSKTRFSYMCEVAAELTTGLWAESFSNAAMEHGTLTEPFARAEYEKREGIIVQQIGFVELNEFVGASPDGIVGEKGLLEIKCPKTSTQIQRFLEGKFPSEYMAQVQGQMWVCEKDWCDFVSFDNRIIGPASYFKIRVDRDELYIKELAAGVEKFISDLHEMLDRLGYART